MATKPLTDQQCIEALNALVKTGGNKEAAARLLKTSVGAFHNRIRAAKKRGIVLGTDKKTPPKDLNEDFFKLEADILRDRVRQLELQIKTAHRETLSDEYVKRKIVGLFETEVEPPEWLIRKPAGSDITGVPTLLASDWHFSEVVDTAQVNGVNEYNIAIARQRARTMIEVTVDLLKNHISNNGYPGIVFALGGDMVSGNIHEELSATNEKEIMPTVVELWATLSWCIETLADEFGNVFVPCVTGNHGRDTHKIRAKGRNYTNFDWLCYQFLAKRFESDDRVQFLIPDGSDAHWQIYNHRYCMTHGDQFRGGDGMIGALGPIIRGDHKKRSRNGQIGVEYDTLLMGHWHQLIQLQRLIVNGSLKGYDEYAYANNFSFEPPRQALWLTHPNHGITFSAPVNVDRISKQKSTSQWVQWKS
jgi:hypothetical protein